MKKLLITLLVSTMLVVVLVLTLPSILTSDTMRGELARQISQASGMNVSLNGPVNLSVFPDLGLVADEVSLESPDGSMAISIEKVIAGVKLSSLLSSPIEITEIDLERPEITLIETAATGGAGAPKGSTDPGNSDPFKAVISLLEGVSLHSVSMRNGKFISQAASGAASETTDIHASLDVPSLDGRVELAFTAVQDGRKVSLDASIAALRPILQRQPTGIEFAVQIIPAPHPALADLKASGTVQLKEDGSYQVSNGQFDVLGQPLSLDALYRPGERPLAIAKLNAEVVDLGVFAKAANTDNSKPESGSGPSEPSTAIDLSPLTNIDADVDVSIKSLVMDGTEVRNIDLAGTLKNGGLSIKLAKANVANGDFAATISSDLRERDPIFRGNLKANSLQIVALEKIANTDIPADGELGLDLAYGFRGTDEQGIRGSLNVAGAIKLSNATVTVDALRGAGLGQSADIISDLNVEAQVQDIQKPVSLAGNLTWMREAIAFQGNLSPRKFVMENAGALRVAAKSNRVNASFDGSVSLDGALSGNAKIATSSLGGLLAWLGQGDNASLRDFSYAGNISLQESQFSFSKSAIVLNGINASGNGMVGLGGKTVINASLAFDTLDLEALTGGSSDAKKSNGSSASGSDTPIDLSALRSLDANIKISAQRLGYGKVNTGPVETTLVVENGVARLQVPQTPFYNGSVLADIVADGSSDVSAIDINAKLASVNARPLFQDAAEFTRIEGLLDASVSTKGAGKTTKQLTRSLSGNAVARFSDGAIRGVDIAKIYNNLSAVLAGGLQENSEDKTQFTEMGMSLTIDQGIASTNDIKLLGPLVRMDGAGTVDLAEEQIDMRLNPQLVGSTAGQGSEFEVAGVGIPLMVQGPLASPRVYPDLTRLMENPQAALQSLSKLGFDIQDPGIGKLDIKNLVLGNDGDGSLNLDQLGGGDSTDQVKKTVEGLIGGSNESGTGQLVGSLLNNLVNPLNQNQANETTDSSSLGDVRPSTGQIPVPTPNPRKTGSVQPQLESAPQNVEVIPENIVEQVTPSVTPTGNEEIPKILDGFLNKILE